MRARASIVLFLITIAGALGVVAYVTFMNLRATAILLGEIPDHGRYIGDAAICEWKAFFVQQGAANFAIAAIPIALFIFVNGRRAHVGRALVAIAIAAIGFTTAFGVRLATQRMILPAEMPRGDRYEQLMSMSEPLDHARRVVFVIAIVATVIFVGGRLISPRVVR